VSDNGGVWVKCDEFGGIFDNVLELKCMCVYRECLCILSIVI
jgi:hypothetical protein